jgi:hypothetical protein
MMDVFDCLNDNAPFDSHNEQLMQAKRHTWPRWKHLRAVGVCTRPC